MEKIKKFLFTNTEQKQIVLKNTFWLLVSEFGIRLLKFFIFIYIVRKLGVAEWGLFSYVFSLMGFFAIFSDIGINTVLLRDTARNQKIHLEYIGSGLLLKVLLASISSLALWILSLLPNKHVGAQALIPIAALLLFTDSLREFGFSLNRALEKMEREALLRISTTILLIPILFFFITKSPSAASLIYGYLTVSVISIIIMYIGFTKYQTKILPYINTKFLLHIWKEAWPLGIATVLGALLGNIDTIILSWFRDVEQIGLYATAQKITQILYLFPLLASTAMLPEMSRLAQADTDTFRKKIKKISNYSYIVTIPLVIICVMTATPLFKLLFGAQYIESAFLFKIMSLSLLTVAPSSIITNALFAQGKQKKLIQFISISLVLNILLCLVLIPKLGILGGAIGVTLSYTIGNLLLIKNYTT